MTVEQTLDSMGLSLPEAAAPLASYVPAVRTGNLVYVSGQLPVVNGAIRYAGSVGDEVSEDDGYDAARIACLNCLAAVKSVIGDLDKVSRIVKITGYVNSALGYTNQPVVVNGASDLLGKLFGDAGKHARAAVGVYELPLDATVEIDMIVEVAD
jgi:enamine deaminase RidA (YjgF/YER057c/UK114 family)